MEAEKNQKKSTSMHLSFCKRVDEILQKYEKKNAVTYMRNDGREDKLTFQDISTFIHETKKDIKRLGLVHGDRVAIISPHSPWAVFMGMALTYSGITITLIDASLPQEEIESLLDYSDVKAVFTTELLYRRFSPDIIVTVPFFCLDEGLKFMQFNKEQTNCLSLSASNNRDIDVIAILYSSGTTGKMKGIMVTYESVLKAREVFVRLSGLKDHMTYLLVLPFNHIAGFTGAMTFFLTGCEIGFIEDVNATKLQSGLIKFQPYYFAMVPKVYEVMEQKIRSAIREKGKIAEGMMNILFKGSKFFRKNFGINIGRKMFHGIVAQVFGQNIFGIGTGASPCKAETTEFFLNLGLEWANLYATTETSVPIVATGIMDRYPVGTVGNINRHPEIQIKIGRPDQNGIGEILVKSQLMMKGYFKSPDLTAEAFEDGFFKTGDYGYIDQKGYLHITGRIKESVILQNGKKVSPSDVDDYYQDRLPEYDIASKGIAARNELYDELHLFVANQNYTVAEQNTIRTNIEKVSAIAPDMYKLSNVHFVSAIPRTSVGKVKRFSLAQEEITIASTKVCEKISSDQVVAIFQEYCKNQEISLSSKLKDDLGLDSLLMFEIVCAINDEFHIDISSEIEDVATVEDVFHLLVNTSSNESISYPRQKSVRMIRKLKRWIRLIKLIYKVEVQGSENVPDNGNYIICANHQSYFDPLWILAAMKNEVNLDKICCMAAIHTMEEKASRKLFDALGGIPVDRGGNTVPAMNCAKKCLKNGDILIVFPEGARSRDGSMLPFKNGAAKLAIDTNTRILPVRIEGAFEAFPRWNKFPHFFDWKHGKKYSIKISFKRLIEPNCVQPNNLMSLVKESISNDKTSIYGSINVSEFIDKQLRNLLELNNNYKISGEMQLKCDLGMNSLKLFELCAAIDENYNVSIESHIHDRITVSEIVDLIQNRASSNLSANDMVNYPIKRYHKDFRSFNRFMRISKFIWKFEVMGEENINPDEQYIFCPNHESHFDGTWIIGMLDDKFKNTICSVAADYLFERRLYRKGIIRMGGIPVHRTGNSAPALKRALECISNEGYSLLIHPEGTRTRNGKLGEFKHGAAKLSMESGVKIVPICISGAYEIFPPHQLVPRLFDWRHVRRYTIKIMYGKPFLPNEMEEEEITRMIRQQIIDMKEQL